MDDESMGRGGAKGGGVVRAVGREGEDGEKGATHGQDRQ